MRLSVDGAAIPVEPLVFRLILYLSDNKDRVVSKSELVDTLWEGRAVSDSALTRAVSLARRALRTPGLPNPIRAVYGTGYQLQDGETDTRSESSSGREAKLAAPAHRFIGREAELSNFGRALAALGNGSGGVFLIRGEAGIGKSRLAEEAIQRAHAMGIPARIGRCSESGGAPSFWPWIQILRQEIEHRGTPEAKEFGELTTRRLNRLVKFADLRPAERSISLLPSTAGDRFSLFDSVSQFLKVRCAQGPAVLVIDDLHCADRESLALLQFITSEVPRAGLLVVAAYREAELPSFERQVVAEIANLSGAEHLELEPLGEPEIAEMLLDRRCDVALARSVGQKSGGNPLFLISLISILTHSPASGLNLLQQEVGSLPSSLRDTIALQLRPLTPTSVHALAAAAVIGRDFDIERLRELLKEDDAAFRAIEEGLKFRVVHEQAGSYRFTHQLVRDYLYESSQLRDRAGWHSILASQLEERSRTTETIAAIAHHARRAIPVAGREFAVACTIRAAEYANSQFAYEEAAAQYEQAAALLRPDLPEDCCQCLLGMSEALVRSGKRPAAWAACTEAVDLARGLQRPDLLAKAALAISPGFLSIETAFYDQGHVDLLEEALALSGNLGGPIRVRLLGRLAAALYWSENHARRNEVSSAALDLANRDSGNFESRAHALYARHSALWGPDFVDERIAIAQELVGIATRLGNPETTLLYRSTLIADLVGAGSTSLDAEIRLFCDEVEQVRQPESMWLPPVFLTMRHLMRGSFNAAEQLAHRTQELGRKVGSEDAQNCWAAQLAMAEFERGNGDKVIELMRAHALEHPNVVRLFGTAPPWAAAELGQHDEARAGFDVYASSGFAAIPRDMNWLGSLAILAMVSAELRDEQSSRKLLELLAPYSERFGTLGYGVLCLGPIAAHLGRLAAISGDLEEADIYFEQGLRMNRAAGSEAWLVRCQYGLGVELLARGAERRGAETLTNALARAGSLGMDHMSKRCTDALQAATGVLSQFLTNS